MNLNTSLRLFIIQYATLETHYSFLNASLSMAQRSKKLFFIAVLVGLMR